MGVDADTSEVHLHAKRWSSDPAERGRTSCDRACGGDAELCGSRSSGCSKPHEQADSFLDRTGGRPDATVDACLRRRSARHADRPLQAAATDRRRGHGRGLHGRADASRSGARWP